MAIKRWNDLTGDEKRLWFDNSMRMHRDLPTQKRQSILEKIEKEREKKRRRESRRKPKWWRK